MIPVNTTLTAAKMMPPTIAGNTTGDLELRQQRGGHQQRQRVDEEADGKHREEAQRSGDQQNHRAHQEIHQTQHEGRSKRFDQQAVAGCRSEINACQQRLP